MKKYFILLLSVIFAFFISCASNKTDIPADEIAPADESVQTEEADEIYENNRELSNQTDENRNSLPEEDETGNPLSFFEEPAPIDEPEITTLPAAENQPEENTSVDSAGSEIVSDENLPELMREADSAGTEDAVLNNEDSAGEINDVMPEKTDDAADNTNGFFDNLQKSDDEVTDADSDKTILIDDENNQEDDVSKKQEEAEKHQPVIPGRKITVKKMEYIDISYPGSGWIYMGLTDGSKALSYFGRKLGTKNTNFTLQARAAGTYIMHFYRNDALTKTYLDDYVEVEILNENGDSKVHKKVTEYKQPVPKVIAEEKTAAAKQDSEIQNENTAGDEKSDVSQSQDTEAVQQSGQDEQEAGESAATLSEEKDTSENNDNGRSENSDTLLKTAETQYNEKQYVGAAETLKKFFESAAEDRDKGLYLQGQILEAKSDIQNIKAAIEAYTALTKNYPSSKYWNDANKRIIYLKRFYLEVR